MSRGLGTENSHPAAVIPERGSGRKLFPSEGLSTRNGAGRVMGRKEAKGKTDRKNGQVLRAGNRGDAILYCVP